MVVNGVRHWVRTVGLRPGVCPLVVVHGGQGGTMYDFERLTGPLLEPHVPVVYYEQRGSGRSDEPRDDRYSIQALVADLLGLLDALDIARATLLASRSVENSRPSSPSPILTASVR